MKYKLKQRKLQKLGNSYYICLPSDWIEHHRLDKKGIINIFLDDDYRLIMEKSK